MQNKKQTALWGKMSLINNASVFPLYFLLLQNMVPPALGQKPTFAWMEEHALKYILCPHPPVCKCLHEQKIYCFILSLIISHTFLMKCFAWNLSLSCSCSANYEGSRCEQYQLFSFVHSREEKGMIAAVVIMALLLIVVLGVVIYYIYKWVTSAFDTVRFRIQYKFYQHDKKHAG